MVVYVGLFGLKDNLDNCTVNVQSLQHGVCGGC